MTTERNYAHEQAIAQMNSISAMVTALQCDYGRLEELREECSIDELDELANLEAAAGDCTDEDDARQRIEEDPLSIEVRSDWHAPGGSSGLCEFKILLCTGGPAVRIIGELNEYKEPCRAWIEYQDWGTPWTELVGGVDHDALLSYCQCFYYDD